MRAIAIAAVLVFACHPEQPAVCRKLIACAGALLPGEHPDLHEAYDPGGTCWKDRTAAERCTENCQAALEGLKVNPKFDETEQCR